MEIIIRQIFNQCSHKVAFGCNKTAGTIFHFAIRQGIAKICLVFCDSPVVGRKMFPC
jgi:hypothetical protein